MAASLLLIVVVVVVSRINANLTVSMMPYKTFPIKVPFGGVLERFRHTAAARGNISIEPNEPEFSIQPKGLGYNLQPKYPVFSIKPRDTEVMKSRPLRYQQNVEIELQCAKKQQVATVRPGDLVKFYSKNYPQQYSKRTKCNWKIVGQTKTTMIRIICVDFKLQARSRKGKCGDYLDIMGHRYCGTDNTSYSSKTNIVNMKFSSDKKKQFLGFLCYGVAEDETPTPCEQSLCGHVNRVPRIVGGSPTEVNEYPWMVALTFYSFSRSAFCGGSIINEKFILTAAHCVAIMDGSEVVVVGEHQWSSSGESSVREKFYISEIISHQDYNPSTMENDIALLRLSGFLRFGSDNKVAPICPPEAGNLYSNINAVVTGWGTTSYGGSVADTLLEVTVPTMSNSECQEDYARYGSDEITDDMICAGLPEGGKDSCQGDSGGPMITHDSSVYRQIGVISWGYGCAYRGIPGVYARVTSKLSWISSKMGGYDWCSPGGRAATPTTTVAPVTPAYSS